jgi:hypothetical protein
MLRVRQVRDEMIAPTRHRVRVGGVSWLSKIICQHENRDWGMQQQWFPSTNRAKHVPEIASLTWLEWVLSFMTANAFA